MDFYDKSCGHKFNKHKFRHAFSDTINSIRACGTEVETTEYFLLRFHFRRRLELFENLEKVEPKFLGLSAKMIKSLFYCMVLKHNSKGVNREILKNVIFYLEATTRFNRPLIDF